MSVERRTIATARLLLQPIDGSHTAGIHAAVVASIDHLLPWMPWAVGINAADIRRFNLAARSAWRDGRAYDFAILEGGVLAGVVTLTLNHGGVGEVGYWVGADRAGRGLATEAASAVVGFGFEELGLYRVELRAGVENVRSLRVAEKLGFQREGLLRNGLDGADGPFDTYMFGMTPEDWTSR